MTAPPRLDRVELQPQFDFAQDQDKFLLHETLLKLNSGINRTANAVDELRRATFVPVVPIVAPAVTESIPSTGTAADFFALSYGPLHGNVQALLADFTLNFAIQNQFDVGSLGPPRDLLSVIDVGPGAGVGTGLILAAVGGALPEGFDSWRPTAITWVYRVIMGGVPLGSISTVTLKVMDPVNSLGNGTVLASASRVHTDVAGLISTGLQTLVIDSTQLGEDWKKRYPLKIQFEFDLPKTHAAASKVYFGPLVVDWRGPE